jgi:hypothetical protein
MTSNGGATYVYDAENRLIATGGYSYIYDGDGERVEKCTEGTTPGTCASGATGTLYWRGLGSDPLSETDLSGNVQNTYIFFNEQRIARRDRRNVNSRRMSLRSQIGKHQCQTDTRPVHVTRKLAMQRKPTGKPLEGTRLELSKGPPPPST